LGKATQIIENRNEEETRHSNGSWFGVLTRFGWSAYDEPMWLGTDEYMLWTDEQWETKAKEVQEKKNGHTARIRTYEECAFANRLTC
jgi:hypothetical protein